MHNENINKLSVKTSMRLAPSAVFFHFATPNRQHKGTYFSYSCVSAKQILVLQLVVCLRSMTQVFVDNLIPIPMLSMSVLFTFIEYCEPVGEVTIF